MRLGIGKPTKPPCGDKKQILSHAVDAQTLEEARIEPQDQRRPEKEFRQQRAAGPVLGLGRKDGSGCTQMNYQLPGVGKQKAGTAEVLAFSKQRSLALGVQHQLHCTAAMAALEGLEVR